MSNQMTAEDPSEVKVGMSIEGGRDITVGEPVHEMLTLAALISSDYKLDPTITHQALRDAPRSHLEINDFIRGVIWNDDPECELFNNSSSSNLDYGLGIAWANKFYLGGFSKPELIHRSHFGDLQWLHAMAAGGDPPADTKRSFYAWMEIMYGIATGAFDPATPIASTAVRDSFDDPTHYATLGELLTHRLGDPAVLAHRALGSCFHVIQDSYARGHTRRERLNPSPAPGEADRWGAVLNFHSYPGQDETLHKHFDHSRDSLAAVDLRRPDTWNGLQGCRDGLDRCIALANFWHRKAPWTQVQQWLDADVFVISPNATPSEPSI